MSTSTIPPIALTIAGSDSGGGAGIQADLKTFHRFGVFGTSVVTAVTAQNTLGVSAVHAIPLDIVRAQLDQVAWDLPPAACKSGMLATAELVREVARGLDRHAIRRYVLDPVMVATSGDRLLDEEAEAELRDSLVPRSTLVTPNLHEAGILTGRPVRDEGDMREAARALVELGAGAALVKGGHLEGSAVDLLWDGEEERIWRRKRIRTRHTHGTGCTLSAAIAAELARSTSLPEAVDRALRFVARAIETAPGLGAGHGPVNHFASVD
jgi:hydroxymethylpyrimidine/phosphomethylpyrimidine kinase